LQEERQSLLLERITKSVHRLNEALQELDRSVVEINNHNQAVIIVSDLSEAVSRDRGCIHVGAGGVADLHLLVSFSQLFQQYRRNAAFNLYNMDAHAEDVQGKSSLG
jgi:hypothetical protein